MGADASSVARVRDAELDAAHLPNTPAAPVPLIDVQNLTKVYGEGPTAVSALRSVTLRIFPREFVAIMGPSGSGKSTFLHLLGCLDRPTAGSYRLAGEEVSRLSRDQLAAIRNKRIGFIFQSFNLLPRTPALENVELPLMYAGIPGTERTRRARELLDDVGLAGRTGHWPSELSGGEQQRVAIARALANGAPLLLADEPTGNLDSVNSTEIMALFRRLNHEREITIVLVTHDLNIAAWSERVITFRDGRVTDDRSSDAVIPASLRAAIGRVTARASAAAVPG